jgi:hypothetical protein
MKAFQARSAPRVYDENMAGQRTDTGLDSGGDYTVGTRAKARV